MICRRNFLRTSPAAYTPRIDVFHMLICKNITRAICIHFSLQQARVRLYPHRDKDSIHIHPGSCPSVSTSTADTRSSPCISRPDNSTGYEYCSSRQLFSAGSRQHAADLSDESNTHPDITLINKTHLTPPLLHRQSRRFFDFGKKHHHR